MYGRIAPRVYGGLERQRPDVFADIGSELEDMLYPGFLAELWPGRLAHYPRYLRAVEERLLNALIEPEAEEAGGDRAEGELS